MILQEKNCTSVVHWLTLTLLIALFSLSFFKPTTALSANREDAKVKVVFKGENAERRADEEEDEQRVPDVGFGVPEGSDPRAPINYPIGFSVPRGPKLGLAISNDGLSLGSAGTGFLLTTGIPKLKRGDRRSGCLSLSNSDPFSLGDEPLVKGSTLNGEAFTIEHDPTTLVHYISDENSWKVRTSDGSTTTYKPGLMARDGEGNPVALDWVADELRDSNNNLVSISYESPDPYTQPPRIKRITYLGHETQEIQTTYEVEVSYRDSFSPYTTVSQRPACTPTVDGGSISNVLPYQKLVDEIAIYRKRGGQRTLLRKVEPAYQQSDNLLPQLREVKHTFKGQDGDKILTTSISYFGHVADLEENLRRDVEQDEEPEALYKERLQLVNINQDPAPDLLNLEGDVDVGGGDITVELTKLNGDGEIYVDERKMLVPANALGADIPIRGYSKISYNGDGIDDLLLASDSSWYVAVLNENGTVASYRPIISRQPFNPQNGTTQFRVLDANRDASEDILVAGGGGDGRISWNLYLSQQNLDDPGNPYYVKHTLTSCDPIDENDDCNVSSILEYTTHRIEARDINGDGLDDIIKTRDAEIPDDPINENTDESESAFSYGGCLSVPINNQNPHGYNCDFYNGNDNGRSVGQEGLGLRYTYRENGPHFGLVGVRKSGGDFPYSGEGGGTIDDFTGDGYPDFLLRRDTNVYIMAGTGTGFEDDLRLLTSEGPQTNEVQPAKIDPDGFTDLYDGDGYAYLNRGGQSFERDATRSHYQNTDGDNITNNGSLSADLNGDSLTDFYSYFRNNDGSAARSDLNLSLSFKKLQVRQVVDPFGKKTSFNYTPGPRGALRRCKDLDPVLSSVKQEDLLGQLSSLHKEYRDCAYDFEHNSALPYRKVTTVDLLSPKDQDPAEDRDYYGLTETINSQEFASKGIPLRRTIGSRYYDRGGQQRMKAETVEETKLKEDSVAPYFTPPERVERQVLNNSGNATTTINRFEYDSYYRQKSKVEDNYRKTFTGYLPPVNTHDEDKPLLAELERSYTLCGDAGATDTCPSDKVLSMTVKDYDDRGNQTELIRVKGFKDNVPQLIKEEAQYNDLGLPVIKIDARGFETEFIYDEDETFSMITKQTQYGNPENAADDLVTDTKYDYDQLKPRQVTDENRRDTFFTYSALGYASYIETPTTITGLALKGIGTKDLRFVELRAKDSKSDWDDQSKRPTHKLSFIRPDGYQWCTQTEGEDGKDRLQQRVASHYGSDKFVYNPTFVPTPQDPLSNSISCPIPTGKGAPREGGGFKAIYRTKHYFDSLGRPIKSVNQRGGVSMIHYNGLTTTYDTPYPGTDDQRTEIKNRYGLLETIKEVPRQGESQGDNTTTISYDKADRKKLVIRGQRTIEDAEYDLLGRTTALTLEGRTVNYDYDPNGNLTFWQDADLADVQGPCPNSKFQGTACVEYSYDAHNRKKETIYHHDDYHDNSTVSVFSYDRLGDGDPLPCNMVGRLTSSYSETSNVRTTYCYTNEGQLRDRRTTLFSNGGASLYEHNTYNALGLPTEISASYSGESGDGEFELNPSYYHNGAVKERQLDGNLILSDINYNAFGAQTSVIYANGFTQATDFNEDTGLASSTIVNAAPNKTTYWADYSYTEDLRLDKKEGSIYLGEDFDQDPQQQGNVGDYQLPIEPERIQDLGNKQQIQARRSRPKAPRAGKAKRAIPQVEFPNRTNPDIGLPDIQPPIDWRGARYVVNEDFGYSAKGQLTSAEGYYNPYNPDGPNHLRTLSYDFEGNERVKSFEGKPLSYMPDDLLTTSPKVIGNSCFEYTPAGRVKGRGAPIGPEDNQSCWVKERFSYDPEGRLIFYSNSDKEESTFYAYDAEGNLIDKNTTSQKPGVPAKNTTYLGPLTVEEDGSLSFNAGELVKNNRHGTINLHTDPVTRNLVQLTQSSGVGDEQTETKAMKRQAPQAQPATQAKIVRSLAYSTYGEPALDTKPDIPISVGTYQGKLYYRESGLYNFGERWLNPKVGHWNAADSLFNPENPRDANLNLAMWGDPPNVADPTGGEENEERPDPPKADTSSDAAKATITCNEGVQEGACDSQIKAAKNIERKMSDKSEKLADTCVKESCVKVQVSQPNKQYPANSTVVKQSGIQIPKGAEQRGAVGPVNPNEPNVTITVSPVKGVPLAVMGFCIQCESKLTPNNNGAAALAASLKSTACPTYCGVAEKPSSKVEVSTPPIAVGPKSGVEQSVVNSVMKENGGKMEVQSSTALPGFFSTPNTFIILVNQQTGEKFIARPNKEPVDWNGNNIMTIRDSVQ